MRTPLVAGNWKMNTTLAEATALARGVRSGVEDVSNVDIVVCPPSVSLVPVSMALQGSTVSIGAQNVCASGQGAHTGEVSADMLGGLCSHVIVGHSERRAMHCETDGSTAAKAVAVIAAGMRPIVCVGESLDIRDAGGAAAYVAGQVRGSLMGVEDGTSLIVAYEPLWAIGTGRAASPEIAQEMLAVIRETLSTLYSTATADAVPLLYGGSVNAGNCAGFFAASDIDGALVGGASLNADEFARIVTAARAAAG